MIRQKPIIHQVQQRSDEWFKLRLGKVTGSNAKFTLVNVSNTDIGAAIRKILDLKAITSSVKLTPEYQQLIEMDPIKLLKQAEMELPETEKRKNYRENIVGERLTGMPADPEPYVSYDMKWGMVNEDMARTVYQMQERCIVEDGPFMEHPDLKAGVSPDGVVTDTKTGEVGLLEIKCLRSANHLFKVIETQDVPLEFVDQIQMQMWIGNYDWCDFVAFDSRLPQGLKLYVKRVKFDEAYVESILEPNIRRFLDQCDAKEKYFRKLIRETKENESMGHNAAKGSNAEAEVIDIEKTS